MKEMSTLKPTLADDALRLLVARLLPGWQGGLEPLAGGGVSQAYGLLHNGEALVLRVSAGGGGYLKDRFAATHFVASGLPIPPILAVGQSEAGLHYALSRRAPGQPLSAWPPAEQHALAPAVLATLARIHALPIEATSGYGPWDEQGNGLWPSWSAFLCSITNPEQPGIYANWTALFADGRLDRDGWETIAAALVQLSADSPAPRALVHGDVGFDNIIADPSGITGVIDWANALYGDPLFDIAWLSFWPSPVDWLALWQAQPGVVWDAQAERRVLCCWCYVALDGMRFFAVSGQPESGAWTCGQMRDHLEEARRRGLL